VAAIWSEQLQIADVGPQDNFYDLGGHSLMAIQVVTAIEKRHGVRVAARELVFHTLRQFAALCEARQAGASSPR
jgi:acyl carrier protein